MSSARQEVSLPSGETLTTATPRPLLGSLTGVRALAASWVVIYHFSLPLFGLFPASEPTRPFVLGGYLGVEIFFVLSGFIIAYNYADRFTTFTLKNYRQFLVLRMARIYPVHLATLLFLFLVVAASAIVGVELTGDSYTPLNLIGNLFLLQAVPPFQPWNVPAWSISVEFAAYLGFPLIALWLATVKTATRGFIVATLVCAVGVAIMMVFVEYDDVVGFYALWWARISVEFTVGALLYSAWRHLGSRMTGPLWDWTALGGVAGAIATLCVVGGDSSVRLIAVPFLALFVLSCAGATGWLGRILSSRVMNWGGRISYSVYLTHFVALVLLGKALPWSQFAPYSLGAVVFVIGYVAIVIGLGAACYHFVEEPARRLIRRAAVRR